MVAAAAMEAQTPAAAADTPAEVPKWMHILRVPSVVWHQLTLNEPRHTRAVLAGVSVSLLTFGRRKVANPLADPTTNAGSRWPAPPPPPLAPFSSGEQLQTGCDACCVMSYNECGNVVAIAQGIQSEGAKWAGRRFRAESVRDW